MSSENEIEVSVIIVNYNTLQMTNACIESVFKHSRSNSIEIILVDNASTDGSKDFFNKEKRINYIYSEENLGFGRANNLGVEYSKGNYVFFLNSDTIMLDDVIKKMYTFADENRINKIGAIGICLIDENRRDALSFGEFITSKRIYKRLLEVLIKSRNNFLIEAYSKIENKGSLQVDFVSGADLFVPKYVFNEVNGFDSDFFMYYEETELQKRMDNAGFKRYIINARDIIHFEGGSFGNKLPFKRKKLMTNGLKLYVDKHYKGIYKFQILFLSLLVLIKDLPKYNYTLKQNIFLIKSLIKN